MNTSEIIVVDWPQGRIALRPETPDDVLFRFALFCNSRLPEWNQVEPTLRAQIMQHQFQAQTVSYQREFPDARFDIIELDGEAIGRIVVDQEESLVHLVDQAIVPERRNRGIGTAIMRDLMVKAATAGQPVQLEVASDNDPCIGLYRRLGFIQTEATELYLRMVWTPEV